MNLEYTVVYSKRKTLSITVERDRSILIHAPEGTKPDKIHQIIETKKLWIFEKIRHPQKYNELPHPPGKELVSGESMPYLGRNYRIEIVDSENDNIYFEQKFFVPKCILNCRRKVFRKWYLEKAREKIIPKVKQYADTMGVSYNKVFITDLKYRWGSCTLNNNLSFNWRLIKAPMFVIDYVIVHELSHLIESNHSLRFWNIVKAHIPNLEKAKLWLKDHGEFLEQDL